MSKEQCSSKTDVKETLDGVDFGEQYKDELQSPKPFNFRFFDNPEEIKTEDEAIDNQIKCSTRSRSFLNFSRIRRDKISLETVDFLMKNKEVRDKIKVLIIIGKQFQYKQEKNYLQHNEDYCVGSLLYHLFHYAYGLPYESILFTCCESKISPNSSPKKDDGDTSSQEPLIDGEDYDQPDQPDFLDFCFLNAVFTQVGTKDFYFHLDQQLVNIVKPFNRHFLKTLNSNEETELYVFFLDHSVPGYFANFDYQFFVQHLSEIPCKRFIIFNDCCYSASLPFLIHTSDMQRLPHLQ